MERKIIFNVYGNNNHFENIEMGNNNITNINQSADIRNIISITENKAIDAIQVLFQEQSINTWKDIMWKLALCLNTETIKEQNNNITDVLNSVKKLHEFFDSIEKAEIITQNMIEK